MAHKIVNQGHIELSDNPSVPMPDRFNVTADAATCPGTWEDDETIDDY